MPDLATIWFLLVGVLLVGYAVLDGFDLGAGTLHLFVARDDDERRTVMRAIGPVWDGNEVWLLTAGGALFAAFPPVYATVFSGFYLALVLLLVALIFRAVSLEFRSKLETAGWRRAWDVAFSIASFLPTLLFGVAIGNVLRGVPLDAAGDYRGGLVGLLNPFALTVGLLSSAMFVMQGATWLALKTEGAVHDRSRRAALLAWPAFVLLWLVVTVYSRVDAGHLWTNYGSPVWWIAPVVFVVVVTAYPVALRANREGLAFGLSSLSIAALIGTMGIGLYPNLLPATGETARSLTVHNASSSDLTLTVMLVIALIGMPLVIAYTAAIYWRFRGRVGPREHVY
jgi:cytochrome bd ubiquinol oxidase subunit II